jgi:hypothetical protein
VDRSTPLCVLYHQKRRTISTVDLTENQKHVLSRLRLANRHFIADITELNWKRGEAYIPDPSMDKGIRRAFSLGNKEAIQSGVEKEENSA